MDNFKFRLQKVLDIKSKDEEESKIKYSKAQMERKEVENALKSLESRYEKYSREINVEDIITRKITSNYLNSLSGQIDKTNNELSQKLDVLNNARVELLNKQIERKSLEKLKESKYNDFKQKESQKEQNINDEFGIYSYFRNMAQSI